MRRRAVVRTVDVRRALSDSKPLLAAVGAGDLAVERLRQLSGQLRHELHPKIVRDRVGTLDVQALPRRTQSIVRGRIDQATGIYDDLAARGRILIGRIRRQKATEDLVEQAQATVRQARATRTAARKATERTTRAAKRTKTEATKTAEAAGRASQAAADKTGEERIGD
jgi:heparin binding hemagglutinin HbhA